MGACCSCHVTGGGTAKRGFIVILLLISTLHKVRLVLLSFVVVIL